MQKIIEKIILNRMLSNQLIGREEYTKNLKTLLDHPIRGIEIE
jgi:hypothetical protein